MFAQCTLFYRKLVKYLKAMGFRLNPYDQCVANIIVKGTQHTIHWHVDDLNLSHKLYHVNTLVINKLKEIYGNDMTVNRGKVQKYLGMILDSSDTNG